MVQVPTTPATEVAPEAVATPEVQAPVVAETKAQKKARKATEKAAQATTVPTPTVEGAAPEVVVPATPKVRGDSGYGITQPKDLPWNAKKIAVFRALHSLGAYDVVSAKPASAVLAANPEAIGATRWVRHYSYFAKAGGLIEVCDKLPEGTAGGGYGFYLTPAGKAVNLDTIAAEQAAAKAAADAVKKAAADKKAEAAKAATAVPAVTVPVAEVAPVA